MNNTAFWHYSNQIYSFNSNIITKITLGNLFRSPFALMLYITKRIVVPNNYPSMLYLLRVHIWHYTLYRLLGQVYFRENVSTCSVSTYAQVGRPVPSREGCEPRRISRHDETAHTTTERVRQTGSRTVACDNSPHAHSKTAGHYHPSFCKLLDGYCVQT